MAAKRNPRREWLEGAGLRLFLAALRPWPIGVVSGFGAALGRIARRFAGHKRDRLRANLAYLRPDADGQELDRLERLAWENLGRIIAEYAVLHRMIPSGRVDVVNIQPSLDAISEGKRILMVSLHLAHFELAPIMSAGWGAPTPVFFKPPNNRYISDILTRIRNGAGVNQFAKNTTGTREALTHFAQPGARLGMLMDERLSGWIMVPSFGHRRMRSSALHSVTRISQREPCVVLPARMKRLNGARFELVLDDPIEPRNTGDPDADEAWLADQVDAVAERWVRDTPEQWVWLQFWGRPQQPASTSGAGGLHQPVPAAGSPRSGGTAVAEPQNNGGNDARQDCRDRQ